MPIITDSLERSSANKWLPWIVCITGSLLFFYEAIQMMMFNSLNTSLMASFNVNATQLGFVSSVYFYTSASLIFVAGNMLDRFSTRMLILMSMLTCTIGTLGFALSPDLIIAAAFRLIVGIGGAFCFLSCVKLASRWFPPSRRAMVVGVIVTMFMLGGWVAQTPLTALIHKFGWRYALFLDGLLGIVITALMWFVIKDRPKKDSHLTAEERETLKKIGLKKAIVSVLKNPNNWCGAFYTCLTNLPVYLVGAFLGSMYLQQAQHLSTSHAAFVSGMIFFGSFLGSTSIGWISDRIKKRRLPMIVGALLILAVVAIIIYVPGLSFIELMLLFFALGYVTSAQVLGYPTVAEHNPAVLTGTAVSIVSTITVFSGAVIFPLAGWLLDVSGQHKKIKGVMHYSLTAYHHAMIILLVAAIGALIAALLIKETNCKHQMDATL
ncbi:MAG: MFS transporter [Legionellaceae bacterium]|nr:MFS transporter [Legionellaceae bacterium]